MMYLILLSRATRDTLWFKSEPNDDFGPDQARAAIADYMLTPVQGGKVYECGGILDAESLDDVYAKAQGENGWKGRSLSVGDAVVPLTEDYDYAGDAYVVDRVGFCMLDGACAKRTATGAA